MANAKEPGKVGESGIVKALRFIRNSAGFFLYTAALAGAVMLLPKPYLDPGSELFLFSIAGLALWRYSWGMLQWIRALIYRTIVFPRMRREVDADVDAYMPSQIYLLVTSFRIAGDTPVKVFRSVISEASACGVPTVIVASIVEMADEFMVKALFQAMNPPDSVRLMMVRIPGTGKRDGLAQGFRAISRDLPNADAVVAVIDGDSILDDGLVRKCVPFFKYMPNVGALTTDEICDVEGSTIIREWHNLRFAQRDIVMGSHALSGKVLTLTGRMSMFRASILISPEFISHVEADAIDHWRLGRFRFLTGDDKSSWYSVLKQGWDMVYVQDTTIRTIEHPPHPNFFKASTQLMYRWFGNMLRTNSRAIRLGPQRTGMFIWWCLLDQRIAMWTSLTGPVFAIMLSVKYDPVFLAIYFVWIGFTRWVMSLMLLASRPTLSWRYPFLLYYNQIWGSLVKTYVLFRLDKQSWTRQKTKLQRPGMTEGQVAFAGRTSVFMHLVAMVTFVAVVGLVSGIFTLHF